VIGYDEQSPSPSPSTPQPQPPPPIHHYTNNFIGLHSATMKQGWDDYARDAKPRLMKTFSCGDTIATKQVQPNMLTIWRKYVGHDDEFLRDEWDNWLHGEELKANALELLDLYSAEIQTHMNNTGMSEAEVLAGIDVLEPLNETYPTFNYEKLITSVEFDVYWSELLHERYGNEMAAMFTAAVGNPHETEFKELIPLAKQSHDTGDYMAYHAYWAADENRSYLAQHAPYHSMRWQVMDEVFVDAGYYPRWYFGECGICYTYPHTNGWTFVPTRGWKSCGAFTDYIDDILEFNNMIKLWNKNNQGRCFGGTLFAYGGWGWDDFNFEPGDLAELSTAMQQFG
jgi:hypothetical protein